MATVVPAPKSQAGDLLAFLQLGQRKQERLQARELADEKVRLEERRLLQEDERIDLAERQQGVAEEKLPTQLRHLNALAEQAQTQTIAANLKMDFDQSVEELKRQMIRDQAAGAKQQVTLGRLQIDAMNILGPEGLAAIKAAQVEQASNRQGQLDTQNALSLMGIQLDLLNQQRQAATALDKTFGNQYAQTVTPMLSSIQGSGVEPRLDQAGRALITYRMRPADQQDPAQLRSLQEDLTAAHSEGLDRLEARTLTGTQGEQRARAGATIRSGAHTAISKILYDEPSATEFNMWIAMHPNEDIPDAFLVQVDESNLKGDWWSTAKGFMKKPKYIVMTRTQADRLNYSYRPLSSAEARSKSVEMQNDNSAALQQTGKSWNETTSLKRKN